MKKKNLIFNTFITLIISFLMVVSGVVIYQLFYGSNVELSFKPNTEFFNEETAMQGNYTIYGNNTLLISDMSESGSIITAYQKSRVNNSGVYLIDSRSKNVYFASLLTHGRVSYTPIYYKSSNEILHFSQLKDYLDGK